MYDKRYFKNDIPESAVSIAENAFQDRNSDVNNNASVAIGCKETEFCGIDTPRLREDKKSIYGFSRGAAIYIM